MLDSQFMLGQRNEIWFRLYVTLHYLFLMIVLEISTTTGNHVCDLYHQNQVVYPLNLHERLFTTAVIYNIDHIPGSTTATDAFHGTALSLFQNLINEKDGHDRKELYISIPKVTTKTLTDLLKIYTNVTPVVQVKKDPSIPRVDKLEKSNGQVISKTFHKDRG